MRRSLELMVAREFLLDAHANQVVRRYVTLRCGVLDPGREVFWNVDFQSFHAEERTTYPRSAIRRS